MPKKTKIIIVGGGAAARDLKAELASLARECPQRIILVDDVPTDSTAVTSFAEKLQVLDAPFYEWRRKTGKSEGRSKKSTAGLATKGTKFTKMRRTNE